MFKKFFGHLQRPGESKHPLGSDENIDALLSEIPSGNPVGVLFEVAEWLDGIERFASEVAPPDLRRAVFRIEEFSRPAFTDLCTRYLTPGSREYLAEQAWGPIEAHCRNVFGAYRHILTETAAKPDPAADLKTLSVCATRAMMAWVARKKLNRMRYRLAGSEWWKAASDLMAVARKLNVHKAAHRPYAGEDARLSVKQAYLVGVYFEIAPLGNMVHPQFEALERFLVREAESLEFSSSPQSTSTHRIDTSAYTGPVRISDSDPPGSAVRYCSGRKLHGKLINLSSELRSSAPMPEWIESIPCSREQTASLIKMLMLHWSSNPPKRETRRQEQAGQLRVAHGFTFARRLLAYANYAREGYLVQYQGSKEMDYETFDAVRFGRTSSFMASSLKPVEEEKPAEPPPATPLEMLERLETSGDQLLMEYWQQTDTSETGLGATAAGLRSIHGVGGLVCYRYPEEIDWRLAIIRRIVRDTEGRTSIGVEKLNGPSLCAMIRQAQDGRSSSAASSFIDAILISAPGDEILVGEALFSPELLMDLKLAGKLRRIKLAQLVEQGSDYQRIRFTTDEALPT